MNTKELEIYLVAGVETQRVDFKESCPWSTRTFAKDILAMSNVQDGGVIIVGIKELDGGGLRREGIESHHGETFDIDQMKDQMTTFADPHVNFSAQVVKDKQDREYVVIRVTEFEEIPVICKKDSGDTKKGVIYYRNRDRRTESAPVSNTHDLRDVIDRAAVKRWAKMRALGLAVGAPRGNDTEAKLDKELGDL